MSLMANEPDALLPAGMLENPGLFINRELSWLQFNGRVLEEALDVRHPLLERVKFLAIFSSNLDEFFMIRVAGLRRKLAAGSHDVPPDGMTAAEQLAAIRRQLLEQLAVQAECWRHDLLPRLRAEGIQLLGYDHLMPPDRDWLRQYFEREIFPVLTPLAFDQAHPFPHISNRSLNLAVVIHDPVAGERFALKGAGRRLLAFAAVASAHEQSGTDRPAVI